MSDQNSNLWPRFVWGLFALSMVFSSAILVSLGWFGLTGSGFTENFPIWLPGVAVSTSYITLHYMLEAQSNIKWCNVSNNWFHQQACLTLVFTIINITSNNPSAYEILLPDSIQLGIWIGVIIKMALFISDTDSLGSCTKVSLVLKSSCVVSQLVLWASVALVYV